jgi:RNA helicase armi
MHYFFFFQASNKSSLLPIYASNLHPIPSDMNDLIENKNGIVIDDQLNFNLDIETESVLTVSIRNNSNRTHVLRGGSFVAQKIPSQLSLVSPIDTDVETIINPSESLTYTFECKAKFIGTSEELFVFNFKDFRIGRLFRIIVDAKVDAIIPQKMHHPIFVEQSKSQRLKVPNLNELNEIPIYVSEIRPYKPPAFTKVRNDVFKVPRYIWNAVLSTTQNEKKSQIECEMAVSDQIPCLLKPLSFETYKERFHALLYLEEVAQTLDFQQYDMESAIMRRCRHYLVLQVPGLAEKRPSLLVGDRAIVSFRWDSSQGNVCG